MSSLEKLMSVQEFSASVGSVSCHLKRMGLGSEFQADQRKFLLFTQYISGGDTLSLVFPEHTIVLLAPIKKEKDVTIVATNVIALNVLESLHGQVDIKVSGKNFDFLAEGNFNKMLLMQRLVIDFYTGIEEGSCQKILHALAGTVRVCLDANFTNGEHDDEPAKALELLGNPPPVSEKVVQEAMQKLYADSHKST